MARIFALSCFATSGNDLDKFISEPFRNVGRKFGRLGEAVGVGVGGRVGKAAELPRDRPRPQNFEAGPVGGGGGHDSKRRPDLEVRPGQVRVGIRSVSR